MSDSAIDALHIILVEDEEILASILSEKLTKSGYRVSVYNNGEDGAREIIAQKPAAVLLDILLPKKNGYEVLEDMKVAGMLPETPVVVISNSGQPVMLEHLEAIGVRDYLVKVDFDPDEVIAKLAAVLNGGTVPHPSSVPQPVPEITSPASIPPTPATSEKQSAVLVVEDAIFIADLLCRKLHESYNVFQASDTAKAEVVLASETIDVICLDIILPGKDGYTFLAELKANPKYRSIPVIILSNLGQREEIERGMNAGAVDYLIKANSSPEEITRHVARALKPKSA